MFKKISLVAFTAVSISLTTAAPASAFCEAGETFDDESGDCIPTETEVIPTPPAILAALGMGFAGLRKKNQGNTQDK